MEAQDGAKHQNQTGQSFPDLKKFLDEIDADCKLEGVRRQKLVERVTFSTL